MNEYKANGWVGVTAAQGSRGHCGCGAACTPTGELFSWMQIIHSSPSRSRPQWQLSDEGRRGRRGNTRRQASRPPASSRGLCWGGKGAGGGLGSSPGAEADHSDVPALLGGSERHSRVLAERGCGGPDSALAAPGCPAPPPPRAEWRGSLTRVAPGLLEEEVARQGRQLLSQQCRRLWCCGADFKASAAPRWHTAPTCHEGGSVRAKGPGLRRGSPRSPRKLAGYVFQITLKTVCWPLPPFCDQETWGSRAAGGQGGASSVQKGAQRSS